MELHYLGADGEYIVADAPLPGLVEVPPRPAPGHVWDGAAWVPDPLAYRAARAAEYPPIGDQLDALWKAFNPPDGSEAAAMLAQVLAVKAAHPKPIP